MIKRSIITLVTLISLFFPYVVHSQTDTPNVLLVYLDDLGFNQLGYFNDQIYTPNIDTLIENSILFKNAYVTSAVCTPSRFSLLTGLYASRSSKIQSSYDYEELPNIEWNTKLESNEANIATILDDHIRTGIVGKWHLGAPSPNKYEKDEDPKSSIVKSKLIEDYESLQRRIESRGFDYCDGLYKANPTQHPLNALDFHNVEWTTSKGLEFINQCVDSSQPFFLYYSTTVPHGPDPETSLGKDQYITPIGILDSADISQSGMLTRKEIFDLNEKLRKSRPGMTWLDSGIGALIHRLKETGIYDNTLIILMSDHQYRGKFSNYEAARVPLIVKPPQYHSGHIEKNELVANIDILPTILSIIGQTENEEEFDGRSFNHYLESTSNKTKSHSNLLLEIGYSKALVNDDRFKIIVNKFPEHLLDSAEKYNSQLTHYGSFYPNNDVRYGSNTIFPHYFDEIQLYDLNNDPDEQVNLICKPDYSLIAHNLYNQLKEKLFDMPQKYSEYTNTIYPLNTTIRKYEHTLEVINIIDSISLSSTDTLLFESTDTVSDTIVFVFVSPDTLSDNVSTKNLSYPNWLELIEPISYLDKKTVITFSTKDVPEESSNVVMLDFGNSLIYKAYLDVLSTPSLDVNINRSELLVYPNPTESNLYVDSDCALDFQLYDMKGATVPITVNQNFLELNKLNKGIYILKAFDKNQQLIFTKKILKK